MSNSEAKHAPDRTWVSLRRWAASAVAGLLACGLLPTSVAAASGPVDWTQSSASGPTPSVQPYLSYDTARNRAVLFGGASSTANVFYSDTWEFDGSTWSKVATTGPSGRGVGRMVYDSARGVSVLFGGITGTNTTLNETWEWNGSSWTQRFPASAPPPRFWFDMTYDSVRHRTVLFGGYGGGVLMADTWEYDGNNWTQVATAHTPPARHSEGLAFDSARNRVVMFGGHDSSGRLNDTWEFGGSDWTQVLAANSPAPRFWHSMGYDPSRQRTVIFGGDYWNSTTLGPNNETWEYDGQTWSQRLTMSRPSPRIEAPMAYDSALGKLVLFGGSDESGRPDVALGDTWLMGSTPTGPSAALSVASIYFQQQPVLIPATRPVTLANTGNVPLNITSIAISGSSDFGTTDGCPRSPLTLAPGATCPITVSFAPTSGGSSLITANLSLADDAGTGTQLLPLSGTGFWGGFIVSPAAVDFGSNQINLAGATATAIVTINAPGQPSVITGLETTGAFTATNLDCPLNTPLPNNGSCRIQVAFTPSAPGTYAGQLVIHDSEPGLQRTMALSGVATPAPGLPLVSLNPGSVDFGSVWTIKTGTSAVTITNSGPGWLHVGGYSIGGPDATSFHAGPDTCGVPIAPAASCNIALSFGNTAAGSYSATLTISDDAAGSPQLLPLTALAVVPTVTIALSPAPLDFGNVPDGTTAQGTITLTNTGSSSYHFGGASVTGNFLIQQVYCPQPVLPGGTCYVYISFTPTTPGASSGTLTVIGDDPASSDTVSITGVGVPPVVSVSPASVDFGSAALVAVANSSVSINNQGPGPLNVSGYSISGVDATSFHTGASNCVAAIRPGGNCYIALTFSNSARGSYAAILTITDDAVGAPQVVALSARAIAPVISLTPSPLDFGSASGGTIGHGLVAITNNGDAAYHFSGATATGDFSIPQINCPYPVLPGTSCFIYVDFTPTQPGTRTGTLTVTGDDPSSPDTSVLSGFGIFPTANLSQSAVDLGSVLVTTTATAAVMITNTGNGPLHFNGYTISDPSFHAGPDTCGAQVAVGASCFITITFNSSTRGSFSANLAISDDAAGSPQVVAVSARALAPVINLTPNPIVFGNVNAGGAGHGVVTITNNGDSTYHFGGATATGDFSIPQINCPYPVQPGTSCFVYVDFTPTQPGARNGTLTVVGDDPGSPDTSVLSGFGLVPSAQVSPVSLTYAAQKAGVSSAAQVVTLANTGNFPLAVSSTSIVGPGAADFRISSNGCSNVNPGSTCRIGVVFKPTYYGSRTATLQIIDNASGGGVQTIALSGTGIAGSLSTAPASINFGTKRVGLTTAGVKLTITNRGNAPLLTTLVEFTGANETDFAITGNSCPKTLAAGASCAITLAFKPTAVGTRSASLKFTTNGAPAVVGIPLTGIGTRT
jgi:hypothetical protein